MPDAPMGQSAEHSAEKALAIAVRALKWYADEKNWAEDNWGVLATVRPPEYGRVGAKARIALKRMESLTALVAERDRYHEALIKINGMGAVCEDFIECSHRSCRDSCAAKLTALAALEGDADV